MSFDEALVIAKGNREAALFLCDWDGFCGMLDDIVDEPGKVKDEELVRRVLNLLGSVCDVGWARANSPRLFPVMVASANAWLDANRLAKCADDRARLGSDVLKSQYTEMERVVAYLCGGFDHMRAVSAGRHFDWDLPLPVKVNEGEG